MLDHDRKLADELGCTELEFRIIFMIRHASGEIEQKRSQRNDGPFALMKDIELKHARLIIDQVRALSPNKIPTKKS